MAHPTPLPGRRAVRVRATVVPTPCSTAVPGPQFRATLLAQQFIRCHGQHVVPSSRAWRSASPTGVKRSSVALLQPASQPQRIHCAVPGLLGPASRPHAISAPARRPRGGIGATPCLESGRTAHHELRDVTVTAVSAGSTGRAREHQVWRGGPGYVGVRSRQRQSLHVPRRLLGSQPGHSAARSISSDANTSSPSKRR